jgi:hypothetical protein
LSVSVPGTDNPIASPTVTRKLSVSLCDFSDAPLRALLLGEPRGFGRFGNNFVKRCLDCCKKRQFECRE